MTYNVRVIRFSLLKVFSDEKQLISKITLEQSNDVHFKGLFYISKFTSSFRKISKCMDLLTLICMIIYVTLQHIYTILNSRIVLKKEIHNYIINTFGLDFSRFVTFLFNFFFVKPQQVFCIIYRLQNNG